MSETQVNIASNPDTVIHTSIGIIDQKLLSFRNIREVSVFPPLTNLRIYTIELAPQMLLTPAVQEIFVGADYSNAWTSRTTWQISRNGVDVSTPFTTQIHSEMRKTTTSDSSNNSGARIIIVISGTSNAKNSGDLWRSGVGNNRQSASRNLSKYNKLDAAIDGKFTNNLDAPLIN